MSPSPATCLAHPDIPATASCGACGADLCPACEVHARGAAWCEPCLAARLHAPAGDPGGFAATPGSAPGFVPPPLSVPGQQVKLPVLAAFFGLVVPGLGTIYAFNGPARRGLIQFAVWALLLWLMVRADGFLSLILFFAWVGFYFWQAVDAHGSARMVNALGRVPTEEEAERMGRGPYLIRNADSRSLGMALLVVGIVLLAIEMGGALLRGMPFLAPLALVAGGAVVIWRARRRPPLRSDATNTASGDLR